MEVRPGPSERKMRWHFRGQRWGRFDGRVTWRYKIEFQVKGWERDYRIRRHNIGTTAKRLQWYRHVLQKEDNDWVKKCMEHEVEVQAKR